MAGDRYTTGLLELFTIQLGLFVSAFFKRFFGRPFYDNLVSNVRDRDSCLYVVNCAIVIFNVVLFFSLFTYRCPIWRFPGPNFRLFKIIAYRYLQLFRWLRYVRRFCGEVDIGRSGATTFIIITSQGRLNVFRIEIRSNVFVGRPCASRFHYFLYVAFIVTRVPYRARYYCSTNDASRTIAVRFIRFEV